MQNVLIRRLLGFESMLHSQPVYCSRCETCLDLVRPGKCPTCGNRRRTYRVVLTSTTSTKCQLLWACTRQYFETRAWLYTVVLLLTAVAATAKFVFPDWPGVATGLVISAAILWLRPRARVLVREVTRGTV